MPDYGTDWASAPDGDLSPDGREVSGRALLAQDVTHRFETPTGFLYPFDPLAQDDGYDLRALLNDSLARTGTIAARMSAECLKDDRVDPPAQVTVEFDATGTMTNDITLNDGDGPFDLTISVSALTGALLLEGP